MTTDDIVKHSDQGRQVEIGKLDFLKAFDKVRHLRLYHSIQKTTQKWINNFLKDRQEQVA